jgi:hypothetical protein
MRGSELALLDRLLDNPQAAAYPSCLISWIQRGPEGGFEARVGRQDSMNAALDAATRRLISRNTDMVRRKGEPRGYGVHRRQFAASRTPRPRYHARGAISGCVALTQVILDSF